MAAEKSDQPTMVGNPDRVGSRVVECAPNCAQSLLQAIMYGTHVLLLGILFAMIGGCKQHPTAARRPAPQPSVLRPDTVRQRARTARHQHGHGAIECECECFKALRVTRPA